MALGGATWWLRLEVPIAWISGVLFITTLLCQSVGSIVILSACSCSLLYGRAICLALSLRCFSLAILAFMGLRVANFISLRSLIERNAVAYSAAQVSKRNSAPIVRMAALSRQEKYIDTALAEPLLGTGAWDWWKGTGSRPWGLWLLALGMYGLAGLLALECLQLLPVARILGSPLARGDTQSFDLLVLSPRRFSCWRLIIL